MASFVKSPTEIWKPVEGYEGYCEVSSFGRIRTIESEYIAKNGRIVRRSARVLRQRPVTGGRMQVKISIFGKMYSISVARAVSKAFVPNPEGFPQINHIDENPRNNAPENLEWCTAKYNVNYGTRLIRANKTRRQKLCCCKAVAQIDKSGKIVKVWPSAVFAEEEEGFSAMAIRVCAGHRGTQKAHKGYRWEYLQNIPDGFTFGETGRSKNAARPVAQKDKEGNVVKIWATVSATDEGGFSHSAVSKCALGKAKPHHGYRWEYMEKL